MANRNVAATAVKLTSVLQTILDVNGDPLTVYLGLTDLDTTTDFFKDITGPVVVVTEPRWKSLELFNKFIEFKIEIKLFWAYPNKESETFIELMNLKSEILENVLDSTNYTPEEEDLDEDGCALFSIPFDGELWDESEEFSQNPRVVLSRLTLLYKGVVNR